MISLRTNKEKIIYLDNAATTPIWPAVINKINKLNEEVYGNPSSIHNVGFKARELIEDARERIAKIINADPEEIYFTSGGSEGNNMVINGCGTQFGNSLITSQFEHHSILRPAEQYKESIFCPVHHGGFVDPNEVKKRISKDTSLVSIMMINNEIGTIQYISRIAEIVHRYPGVLLHTDAVQAVGHIGVDVKYLGVDMLTASAHKFGGPKGIGFIYISRGVKIAPLILGGMQESGFRAGTENVIGIVAMADALELSEKHRHGFSISRYRDIFLNKIDGLGFEINGSLINRYEGNANIYIPGVDGQDLSALLANDGICISTGSACNAGDPKPSHVLKALGYSDERANSSVRITFGPQNTEKEIDEAAKKMKYYVNMLRGLS